MGGSTKSLCQVVQYVCEIRQQMAAVVVGTGYIQQESEGVEALMGEFFPATRVGCLLRNWDRAWSI